MQFGFNILCPERGESAPRAPFEVNLLDLCRRIRRENEILFSVLSTYSLDWNYTRMVCSDLFESAPSLILHGDRKKLVVGLHSGEPRSQCQSHRIRVYEVNPHLYCRRSQIPACGIGSKRQRNNKGAGGVHHAKYILIFCRDKLVVVILTANLVPQTSIDALWIQEFPAQPVIINLPSVLPVKKTDEQRLDKENDEKPTNNEFGNVLQNFLISVWIMHS